MSKEDYAGMDLTPEELAILSEPDDDDPHATQGDLEDAAGITTIKDEKPDDKPTDPAATGTAPGAPAAADAGAAAAAAEPAATADPATAEPSPAPGAAPQPAPILVAAAPDDATAKLKQIAEDKAVLRQKYDDGDLTFAEYEAQKETLDEQRMDIRLAVEKAQTAQQMAAQQQQNQWNTDCANFLDANAASYAGEANAGQLADLDAAIKAIAVMPSSANLTGPQILDRAHRAVMAAHGKPVVDAKAALAKPAEVPKPTLPPDLGKMPAATTTDVADGKWASLDRLQSSNPEAYEAALAKMSVAERDAYLAA